MKRQISEEEHRRRSEAHKGKPLSDAHRQAIKEGHQKSTCKTETARAKSEKLKGHSVSEATRQKISASLQGRKQSEEEKHKKREAQKRIDTPEYRAKVSEGVKRAYENPEFKATHAAHLTSPETKAKNLAARRPLTEEEREQKSQTLRALWKNPEFRARQQLGMQRVIATPEYYQAKAEGMAKAQKRWRGTDIELAVEAVLQTLEIGYETQKAIGRYVVDFYVPSKNLVIECDGEYWHDRPEMQAKDARKDTYFASKGYHVLRLLGSQIRKRDFTALKEALREEET